jgi:hypothetical protein
LKNDLPNNKLIAMKPYVLTILLCWSLLNTNICSSQTEKANILVGVFDGRTPCQELAKQLNEQTTPECIKIKWRLKLFKELATANSGVFELEGFGFRGANTLKGTWHTTTGTVANPEAIVYQLNHAQRGPLFLQKADDNVFFFLDRQKNLMVGNRDFSYTLNRVPNKL